MHKSKAEEPKKCKGKTLFKRIVLVHDENGITQVSDIFITLRVTKEKHLGQRSQEICEEKTCKNKYKQVFLVSFALLLFLLFQSDIWSLYTSTAGEKNFRELKNIILLFV
ncbi:MAG: hypothetical protein IJ693_06455 [Bacteroidaceae bacterium]|nr:hypothetical protein [Bacteroidaceae bacterium]